MMLEDEHFLELDEDELFLELDDYEDYLFVKKVLIEEVSKQDDYELNYCLILADAIINNEQDCKEALIYINKAKESDKDNVLIDYLLGEYYVQKDDNKKAKEHYDKYLKNAEYPIGAAFNQRGTLEDDYDKARVYFEKAYEIDNSFDDYLLTNALFFIYSKDEEGFQKFYDKVKDWDDEYVYEYLTLIKISTFHEYPYPKGTYKLFKDFLKKYKSIYNTSQPLAYVYDRCLFMFLLCENRDRDIYLLCKRKVNALEWQEIYRSELVEYIKYREDGNVNNSWLIKMKNLI